MFQVAAAIALYTLTAQSQLVNWEHDASIAFQKAIESKKIVMIDFETDWCGFCKKMDATTFNDPKVVAQSKRFVFLKLDAEKEGKNLAQKYNIEAFPTMVFVDPDLGVVGRSRGFKSVEDWTFTADSVLHARSDYISTLAKVKPEDRTVQDRMRMAEIYAVWSRPEDAIKEFDAASNLVSDMNEIGETAVKIADSLVAVGRDEASLKYYTIASSDLRSIELLAHTMDSAIYAAQRAGKPNEAKEWARKLYTWKDCPKALKMSAEAAYHRLGG